MLQGKFRKKSKNHEGGGADSDTDDKKINVMNIPKI